MDACAKVYITSDYSVELNKEDMKMIVADTCQELYAMPRPADYTVADILDQANYEVRIYIEWILENAGKDYMFGDLDNKQRTKEECWQVTKKVLEKIDAIIK